VGKTAATETREDTIESLAGRVAVVTGSASGIGLASASALARRGATVAITSRDAGRARTVAETIVAAGGSAHSFVLDLDDPANGATLIEDVVRRLERIDILVNNAGHSMVRSSEELTLAEWQRAIDVMLTAPFVCAQAAGQVMLAQGSGVIVNVGSILSHTALPMRAAYTSAKHGLLGLTRTLAAEWAPRGVRVLSVDPAFVHTELVAESMANGGFALEAITGRTPLGRLAEPAEVGRLIAFLASDAAAYMTGTATVLDGGWLAHGGW
jgi:NAD(P)-dependent dehydrogenase (short-subunit alcohol dehydrogenase family)